MKKTYISPVIEDMFMETDNILQASLEVFTGEEAPELEDSYDILSRVIGGEGVTPMDLIK